MIFQPGNLEHLVLGVPLGKSQLFCLSFNLKTISNLAAAKHKTSKFRETVLYPETDLACVKTVHFLVSKTDKQALKAHNAVMETNGYLHSISEGELSLTQCTSHIRCKALYYSLKPKALAL